MKVLYISRALVGYSGSGVGARMHLDALKTAVGCDNVYVINLSVHAKAERSGNYIAYGKYSSKLERIVRHLQGNGFYISNSIIREICQLIQSECIEFVFIDDSVFGNLVKAIKHSNSNIPVVTFYHDVKAELYPKWMSRYPLFDKINWRLEMKEEKKSAAWTDANIVLNKAEDDFLYKHYGIHADFFLPVSVPKSEEEGCNPFDTIKKHLLFVGTAYAPNINGLKWFYENVFGKIRKDYDIWVVGKGLECLKTEYSDEDVHIIGFVDSIVAYYQFCDVVIAPLTDGGGMKIKTAEAISFGKTFVGSSESLNGYYEEMSDQIKEKFVFRCDDITEYLRAFDKITTILEKENTELIELYNKKFSTAAAVNTVSEILKRKCKR